MLRALSILSCILVFNTVKSQELSYKHFTEAQGLNSDKVYSILQDKRGFIWFATDAGVAKYDGYNFKKFDTSNGLPDNDVLHLCEDRTGKIWLIIYNNPPVYIIDDSVHQFNPDRIFDGTNINNIITDNLGTTWFSTSSKGIIKYINGKIEKLDKHNSNIKFNNTILAEDSNGNIWISTYFGYFEASNPKNAVAIDKSYFEQEALLHLFFAKNGKIYGYNRKNFYLLENSKPKSILNGNSTPNKFIIYYVSPHSDNSVLVSTSDGVFHISLSSFKIIHHYKKNTGTSRALVDNEGNIWITTLDDGVFFLSRNSANITHIIPDNDIKSTLTNIVFDARTKQHVIGTVSGRLLTLKKDSLSEIKLNNSDILGTLNNCINDSKNNLWCVCDAYVVKFTNGNYRVNNQVKFDFINEYFQKEALEGALLVDTGINIYTISGKDIAIDKKDRIWIATVFGTFRLTPLGAKYKFEQISNNRTIAICADLEDKIWIAGENGLAYFDGKKFNQYQFLNQTLRGNIKDIAFDKFNRLWIATHGFGIYVTKNGQARNFNNKLGLSSNIVHNLCIDGNHIWAATKSGINKIIMDKEGTIKQVAPLEINADLHYPDIKNIIKTDSFLYALSPKGISYFNLNLATIDTSKAVVHITKFLVNDSSVAISAHNVFEYHFNSIKIEYVGISYKSNGNLLYRYQLEGIDTAWTESSFRNIQYPSLPPGKYTFKVDARSLYGNWSNQPASIIFIIKPPYWQSWWFKALMALLFVAVLAAITFAIIRYYRNRAELSKRLAQLQSQALRAQMNPHFIFNSLNAIHDFIADQDQRSAHLYLSKFAALIRRILDFSRKHEISLQDELETLRLYVELENLRFENKFDFQIEVNTVTHPFDLVIPPMLLQPYVENAIRHGLQKKQGKGSLTLSIKEIGSELHCWITDDGVGRKYAEAHGTNLKSHRSYGMEITKERMQLIDQGHQIKIIDMEDEMGHATGTKVELIIPIKTIT
ncbi:MAG: two-component regulator propeller domain-containing protein [Chitinophagales bacterium]|nr:two-component regulator propeller domain-containing protein [Chitinophagales bacterium]